MTVEMSINHLNYISHFIIELVLLWVHYQCLQRSSRRPSITLHSDVTKVRRRFEGWKTTFVASVA